MLYERKSRRGKGKNYIVEVSYLWTDFLRLGGMHEGIPVFSGNVRKGSSQESDGILIRVTMGLDIAQKVSRRASFSFLIIYAFAFIYTEHSFPNTCKSRRLNPKTLIILI